LPFLVLLFTGCDPSDDNNADNFDRGAYLTETADNIIVPAYAEFAEESQSLKQALDALVQVTQTPGTPNGIGLRVSDQMGGEITQDWRKHPQVQCK